MAPLSLKSARLLSTKAATGLRLFLSTCRVKRKRVLAYRLGESKEILRSSREEVEDSDETAAE